MAGEWTVAKWGEIATLAYGRALNGYSKTKGIARVYGTNGPIGWHDEARWDGPGVIVGRKGAYRGVHYSTAPYWVIDTAYSLRPKVDLNLRWAYYQLKYLDVNNIDDGSPIPSTTRDAFYVQNLLLPPREEQDRITELLSSLDDKVDANLRTAATLEDIARAVFKSWFVDFDPVRAKSKGHPTGLPDTTAALFPDHFEENGLPAGWGKVPLLEHARLISGGTPKTDEPAYWDGPVLWASAKDVSQCADRFLISTERTVTHRGLQESAARLVPALSTVVVARGATTGRHCVFGREMAMNQTCYALHSEAKRPFWLACTFSAMVNDLVRGAHGSVFDTITTTTLKTAKVIYGGDEIVSAFERTAQPIYERILNLVEESATLRAVRDTLLPKLISGELRIKDAGATEVAA
ncbi:restriction endonuclease subunit S [Shinella zoogloeoides]|uniref:restriction endonuclease subunit S n=1 Tax=Shinella zoogloeoides TaxID=352475 RepID=UPI001F594B1C|nr:restriction endonuclease subunit S [Shinella zoogloeoides]